MKLVEAYEASKEANLDSFIKPAMSDLFKRLRQESEILANSYDEIADTERLYRIQLVQEALQRRGDSKYYAKDSQREESEQPAVKKSGKPLTHSDDVW